MRQLVINELKSEDRDLLDNYLSDKLESGPIVGVYWIPLPSELLAEAQEGHEACGPFVFGVEVGDDFVTFEMLVRSKENLHCSCTSYATIEQRQFLLGFFDKMVSETEIKC